MILEQVRELQLTRTDDLFPAQGGIIPYKEEAQYHKDDGEEYDRVFYIAPDGIDAVAAHSIKYMPNRALNK
jgi:hypothetical protein